MCWCVGRWLRWSLPCLASFFLPALLFGGATALRARATGGCFLLGRGGLMLLIAGLALGLLSFLLCRSFEHGTLELLLAANLFPGVADMLASNGDLDGLDML